MFSDGHTITPGGKLVRIKMKFADFLRRHTSDVTLGVFEAKSVP